MIKISELSKTHYRPKDISEFLGVTTRTLQNWDREGKIFFRRDPISDRRYLTKDDVVILLREYNLLVDDISDEKYDIIYSRVLSQDKQISLDELETLIGKNQLERLFLEHYLTLIDKEINIETDNDLN